MAKKATKKIAKQAGVAKIAKKRSASKRDLVKTPTGSFFAKREEEGQFTELDEVGRSLRADRARKAKTIVKAGYGDQGDQARRKTAKKTAKKK